ncbi:MAG TPA: taurine ABC transporter substrate-binding protein [Hyphomicrobiaceae bacterium]
MKNKRWGVFFGSLIASAMLATAAQAAEKVIVATFGDPTPAQWAAHEHKFADATGWDVEWRKFASGTDVIAAMASGDIKIAELGSSPLAIAATQGVDLEMFMIEYVIGNSESLIVRNGSGIKTLADLKGKRVAVPIGSTAHFSLMGALKHAGIAEHELTIMNMSPDQIAAAWQQSAIDAAFVWPPTQTEILQTGERLIGAGEVAAWGYPTFNAWVVNRDFAASHEKGLIAFIRTFDDANEAYLKDPAAWTADSAPIKAIAAQTGADPRQVPETIQGYTFLPLAEQLKPQWLGGSIAKTLKATAEFLKSAGRLDDVADDYSSYVTVDYVKKAVR